MNRQSIIESLAGPSALPWETLSYCLKHPEQTEQIFIMLLERSIRKPETLDLQERRALFYGIHLLAALKIPTATQPLLALLCGDERTTANLVGDAIATTIPRVLMALGQDNEPDYWEAACNPALDWLVRDAFLRAWTWQVLEGSIDRKVAEEKLRVLPDILQLPADDMFWLSWMTAIAHLGLAELAEDVPEKIASGQIDASQQTVATDDLADFERELQEAIQNNSSPEWRTKHGYIAFGPSFADFELASRTFPGLTTAKETPQLLAADKETPFGDQAD